MTAKRDSVPPLPDAAPPPPDSAPSPPVTATTVVASTLARFVPAYGIAALLEHFLGDTPLLSLTTGVALGFCLLGGYASWTAIAAVLVAVEATSALANPTASPVTFLTAITLPFIAATGIRFTLSRCPDLSRTIDLIAVVAIGAIAAPLTLGLLEAGVPPGGSFGHALRTSFVSNGIGVLVVVPVILSWSRVGFRQITQQTSLEMSVTLLSTCAAIPLVFSSETSVLGAIPNLQYLILPLTLWCAFRYRLEIVSLQILLVSIAGVTLLESNGAGSTGALAAQIFVSTMALTALILNVTATERRVADDAALRLRDALASAEKREIVSRVAAGIAHDFKNDLHVARGWLEELAHEIDANDPAIREAVDYIQDALDRSTELTHRLLDLSSEARPPTSQTDLSDLLPNAVGAWTSIVGPKSRVECAPVGSVRVRAPKTELEHAILNLILNARDAMPAGGLITLRTESVVVREARFATYPELKPGRYIAIHVEDEGHGFRPELRDRIFEPFFTTKGSEHGTGLGLASVASFARQCRGTVHAESTPGEGSVLTIVLPIVPPSGAPERVGLAERSPKSERTRSEIERTHGRE